MRNSINRKLPAKQIWFVILILSGSTAFSQDDQADPLPLKPANTSSPRATLRTFIDELNFALAEQQRSGIQLRTPRAYFAYARAARTLDFKSTPDNSSSEVRVGRVLALKEVLNRLEIPPDSEIPDVSMVAESGIKRWSIPDSKITIQLIESGPNAGEFLFSADTVQRLLRYYAYVKDLPLREGAVPSIYEDYQAAIAASAEAEGGIRNQLKPVDTSSPRSTFAGFRSSMNRAYEIVMNAEAAMNAKPPTMTAEEVRQQEKAAELLVRRAIATLDLSQVPNAFEQDLGIESALKLKEILDRMTPPPTELVPDSEFVVATRSRLGNRPFLWRYPNTSIEIVEIVEGPQQGQFLFSAQTVGQLGDLYRRARGLPYREDDRGALAPEFSSPATSPGFFDYYSTTPGNLIPATTWLGRLVNGLPAWFKQQGGFGQTRWQWIAVVICILVTVALCIVVRILIRRIAAKLNNPWDDWVRILLSLVTAGLLALLIHVFDKDLNLTGGASVVLTSAGQLIALVFLAIAAWRLCEATSETLLVVPRSRSSGVRPTPVRLVSRVVGGLTFALILGMGLQHLGVNVLAIVAGLSIGGLAIGLAGRSTVENLISSLLIFADQPYKVGERIVVMGHDGIVEAIGMRSTRIRLLNGHVTSIPNEKMAASDIENIGRRPYIRRLFNLTLHFSTSPVKVRRAIEIMREILAVPDDGNAEHPNAAINRPDHPPRVYFDRINDDSLNIYVAYWYHPADYWNYMEHANSVNIRIMESFEAEGIAFSMPSQEVHLIGDRQRQEPFAVDEHEKS
jgi:MscS family membrane protein